MYLQEVSNYFTDKGIHCDVEIFIKPHTEPIMWSGTLSDAFDKFWDHEIDTINPKVLMEMSTSENVAKAYCKLRFSLISPRFYNK